MSDPALQRLRAANPVPTATTVPEPWHQGLVSRLAEPIPTRNGGRSRRRILLIAIAAAALLALPSYGLTRTVADWVRGEPAPQDVVDDFRSYTPQLGYRPDPQGAILVAADTRGTKLYATPNDRGSYCLVLTAPGRPRGDGGTCIKPEWATRPLLAGTLGATAGESQAAIHFIGGRTTVPAAAVIRLTDPAGRPIERPIQFDGFFVAAITVPRSACGDGDWTPTFALHDKEGKELLRARITLLYTHAAQAGCGFTPPHPPIG